MFVNYVQRHERQFGGPVRYISSHHYYYYNSFSTVFCLLSSSICNSYPHQVSHCSSSLTTPANGEVTCTYGREVGSQCFFGCYTDFRLSESSSRNCTRSRHSAYWSGYEPHCIGAKSNMFKSLNSEEQMINSISVLLQLYCRWVRTGSADLVECRSGLYLWGQ